MNWIDSIKIVRKAQENNRLVIFVGAGISRNSGVPTWGELIRIIADRIGYSRCANCDSTLKCSGTECEKSQKFLQEEFLRIPEYLYLDDDTEKSKENYYEVIKTALKSDAKPNRINYEVFNLLPHHIITTNFDKLLESTTSVNSQLYSVISEDGEMLSHASERYIIKMHGDIDKPDTLVLKESDYINYEQKHPLISTFIRSLLINHTFLFIGYSLNDINLNLIIGWINFFAQQLGAKERPLNFLLQAQSVTEFEKKRLKSKNIVVIELNELPETLVDDVAQNTDITHDSGKRVLAYLRSVYDERELQKYLPFSSIIEDKYSYLESYKHIAHEDLLSVLPIPEAKFKDSCLVVFDEEQYQGFSLLLRDNNVRLIRTLQKAGITSIQSRKSGNTTNVPRQKISDDIMQLYLDNDYLRIKIEIDKSTDTASRIYYYSLLKMEGPIVEQEVLREETQLSLSESEDYISLLLHKTRARLATLSLYDRQEARTRELAKLFDTIPNKYRKVTTFLRMLFENPKTNLHRMQELLSKQETRVFQTSGYFESGHAHTHIWELKSFAYNYYFFFKKNHLPIDYFTNPKDYLSYYMQAILSSYVRPSQKATGFLGVSTHQECYVLNEIDLDMLVKFVSQKQLNKWIYDFAISTLELDASIDIKQKFNNLCDSLERFNVEQWTEYLLTFSTLICFLKLSDETKQTMLCRITSTFKSFVPKSPHYSLRVFEAIAYLVMHSSIVTSRQCAYDLLNAFLDDEIFQHLLDFHKNKLKNVIGRISKNIGEEDKLSLSKKINSIVDEKSRMKKILIVHEALSISEHVEFLRQNLVNIGSDNLFTLLYKKIIPFDQEIENLLYGRIEEKYTEKINANGVYSYPDWFTINIEIFILLKLIGFDINIQRLEPFVEFSDHLSFILSPDEFDYSKVDLNHYMWQNFLYSPQYQDFFLRHKTEILTEELHDVFLRRQDTREQQKIVYGIFLENEELRDYPK